MRTVSQSLLRIAALALALCVIAVCCCSCRNNETPTVIDPVDDTAASTTAPANTTATRATTTVTGFPTQPTIATPATQLTLSELIPMVSSTISWSSLESYDHTKTGDNTATFEVNDGYGKICTLNVTIDPATNNLTEAVLSYNDASASILSDFRMCILPVMQALGSEE